MTSSAVAKIGTVRSVNVSPARDVEWHGRSWRTGIFKSPIDGAVRVEGVQVAGDEQADLSVHGGPTKAVYAYPEEHYAWWRDELSAGATEVLSVPGAFGENLTTRGLLEKDTGVGDLFRFGTTLLRVTEPRLPCSKLGLKFDDPGMTRRFHNASRNGVYFAIEEPGEVAAGDEIHVESRHRHRLTTHEIVEFYTKRERTEAIRARAESHAALSDAWREWFASAEVSS